LEKTAVRDRRLMTGNEAIAYGAYLAGVRTGYAYPGTPSTEILESLALYEGVRAEWAPNEKVALDAAVGAAYAGARSLCAMKHVGVNVAADSLFYASYTGVGAGLVLVTADDPGMYSSQNEQDNRHYARFAKVPVLEPSDSEEAKRFVGLAFDLSERFDTPVLLRSTTRLSHSRSPVTIEDGRSTRPEPGGRNKVPGFRRAPSKYVMVPAFARGRHPVVERRMGELARFAESFEENRLEEGDRRLGVIAAGLAYQYAREVLPCATFLKLGMTYPLPRRLVLELASRVEKVVVIEELDPFIEEQVRLMGVDVVGKSVFPAVGELNPSVVRRGAVEAGLWEEPPDGAPAARTAPAEASFVVPPRPPVLCPGCGHRGVFYVLHRLRARSFGDIGCYTLGVMPPLSAIDTCGCMGASIGVLHGVVSAGDHERSVAVIGDSTFFHSGIAPLINLVYNKGAGTVIVLDNRITAMTGHQDHPGTGRTLQGEEAYAIDVADVARAVGVRHVTVIDPFDLDGLEETLKEYMALDEPALVVARRPCALRAKVAGTPYRINEERCTDCGACLRLGCPPIVREGKRVRIESSLCTGCGLCAEVCRFDAIERGVETS